MWTQSANDSKQLVHTLNASVEQKQREVNELLAERQSIKHTHQGLELRHRIQTSHAAFLEQANHKLLEKTRVIGDQLQELMWVFFEIMEFWLLNLVAKESS